MFLKYHSLFEVNKGEPEHHAESIYVIGANWNICMEQPIQEQVERGVLYIPVRGLDGSYLDDVVYDEVAAYVDEVFGQINKALLSLTGRGHVRWPAFGIGLDRFKVAMKAPRLFRHIAVNYQHVLAIGLIGLPPSAREIEDSFDLNEVTLGMRIDEFGTRSRWHPLPATA